MGDIEEEAFAPTREAVHQVLQSIERYNPGNLALFVEYVADTINKGEYDIQAYLAVLKLFQFNTSLHDLATTRTILLKALTGLPHNHFSLCLALLTEEHHQHPEIARVMQLNTLLETCRFEQFWAEMAGNKDLLNCTVQLDSESGETLPVELVGFNDAIRDFIAYVIEATYDAVPHAVAAKMLGGPSFVEPIAQSHGWQKLADGMYFVAEKESTVTSKDITEKLSLSSLVPMMVASQLS